MKFIPILSALSLAFAASHLEAQNPIKGTNTDAKYANTTVVYKDSTTTDLNILSKLDNQDLGIGDVVRITVAPPKPAPAPVVKTRTAAPATQNFDKPVAPQAQLMASSDPSASFTAVTVNAKYTSPNITSRTRDEEDASNAIRQEKVSIPKMETPVAAPATVETPAVAAPAPETNTAAPEAVRHAAHASSGRAASASKSHRSSSGIFNWFGTRTYHKKGSQQYGCYKFH
jgi:hypothetical protein